MNENRNIHITVRPVADREGEYIAHYASEFLQADFCVYIKDSIFGALALQALAEMVRKAFGKNYRSQEIDFDVSQEASSFRQQSACGRGGGSPTRFLRLTDSLGFLGGPGHPWRRQPQDLVSWMLAARLPGAALRATRTWPEETVHGAPTVL